MKIKDLLTDESKWVQQTYALDEVGNNVYSNNPNATRWCLVGALYRCYGDSSTVLSVIYRKVYTAIGNQLISEWNDDPDRTFADIKHLIDTLDI